MHKTCHCFVVVVVVYFLEVHNISYSFTTNEFLKMNNRGIQYQNFLEGRIDTCARICDTLYILVVHYSISCQANYRKLCLNPLVGYNYFMIKEHFKLRNHLNWKNKSDKLTIIIVIIININYIKNTKYLTAFSPPTTFNIYRALITKFSVKKTIKIQ